eukprot:3712785-Rhodomonas_salina.1
MSGSDVRYGAYASPAQCLVQTYRYAVPPIRCPVLIKRMVLCAYASSRLYPPTKLLRNSYAMSGTDLAYPNGRWAWEGSLTPLTCFQHPLSRVRAPFINPPTHPHPF